MKYLSEFFVPYDSFLESNILLAFKSCILNSFVVIKSTFVDFFVLKIYALSTHSYTWLKKKIKRFYSTLEYHAGNTYFEMGLYK